MQPLSPRSSSGADPVAAASNSAAAAPVVSPMDPLRKVDAQPREHRPLVLRVSPLVFLLVPAICFYLSALLASFTLHLSSDGGGSTGSTGVGEDAPCSSSLRLFLWGAVILGYTFVLGFAAMVVGPRTSALSPRLRWAMLLLFAGLLGALTALGGRQVLRGGLAPLPGAQRVFPGVLLHLRVLPPLVAGARCGLGGRICKGILLPEQRESGRSGRWCRTGKTAHE